MSIKYKYIRQSRIVKETYDANKNWATADGEQAKSEPIMYIVKVKVKVCFIWTTIWQKQCDISDGDTRQYICGQAKKIQETLAEM